AGRAAWAAGAELGARPSPPGGVAERGVLIVVHTPPRQELPDHILRHGEDTNPTRQRGRVAFPSLARRVGVRVVRQTYPVGSPTPFSSVSCTARSWSAVKSAFFSPRMIFAMSAASAT